ncbi:MAG: serine hydrolase domain-containing protein [Saprospiraceae bacterium]|nr:serine hydrolase domain-containing protein [Saprospiraceae bacterium]
MRQIITLVLSFILAASTSFCQNKNTVNNTSDNHQEVSKLFIEGINSASAERQKALVPLVFADELITSKGADALVGLFQTLHQQFAPLNLHHADINQFNKPEGTVYVMHIYAKKKSEIMWQDFQLYVTAPPAQKIKQLAFIAEVSEPINLPNGAIQQKETLDWLDKYIKNLHSEYDLSGSILIAEKGEVLYERHFGYADLDKKVKISNQTLFNIASGGKMFTAIAIAKLAEQGKLKYDDKITKYLNGFSDKSKADKITIHHLLSHTSGIAEYWSGQNDKAVFSATNINDHLKIVYNAGFDFEAGKQYQYCNSNFILLGAIIEKVTEKSFYDVIQSEIFKPAGMTASGYFNYGSKNVAIPLTREEQENTWVEVTRHGIKGSSAGGAYSNGRDILKFSRVLKNNALISDKTFKDMLTPKNKGLDVTEDYGYGFIIQKSAQEITYGHGGTADGVNFEFRYFPGQDITLVVFSNQNNGAYDDLKRNAIKLISGDR